MPTTNARRRAAAATILAGIALTACGQATAEPAAEAAAAHAKRTIKFEVAEDAGRFVFADEPVLDSGMPAYGNGFVTQGFLYPAGTLTSSNGIIVDEQPDGTKTYRPEFPKKVIGTWTCYGYFIGNGADTTPEDGPWVASTQIYEFTDGSVLTSLGTENVPGDEPASRPLTGGAGRYAGIDGQVSQRILGYNAGEGVNAAFTVEVARR